MAYGLKLETAERSTANFACFLAYLRLALPSWPSCRSMNCGKKGEQQVGGRSEALSGFSWCWALLCAIGFECFWDRMRRFRMRRLVLAGACLPGCLAACLVQTRPAKGPLDLLYPKACLLQLL